jgi:DtxR family Mn-dependent transcriptional regulator
MIAPETALLVAIFIILMLFFIFWPDKGLYAWFRDLKGSDKKEIMEDALKYIYNSERKNITCTLEDLAQNLTIDSGQARQLLKRLDEMDLIVLQDQGFRLTPEGKAYSLRIIRIHRLWERYLAEETGVPETDWHAEAEKMEHKFSEEEINAISRQLGYPRYDPHGDPIPTRTGDLPPQTGHPFSVFDEGDIVQVNHVEDEPPAVYEEIINKGIHLGTQIEILKKTENRTHVLIKGVVQTLLPQQMINITGTLSHEKKETEEALQPLSSLKQGQSAEVAGISRACRGAQRRRLMDLGIVPGTIISLRMVSLGGDPRAYQIRGATIALRNDQARFVQIKHVSKGRKYVSEYKASL